MRCRQHGNPRTGHRNWRKLRGRSKSEAAATTSEHLLPTGCWARVGGREGVAGFGFGLLGLGSSMGFSFGFRGFKA